MGMAGFRAIGETDFSRMSAGMIRAIARAMSGDGLDADGRSIGQAGVTHSQSVAELERDIATLTQRWTGEAGAGVLAHVSRFARQSYLVDWEVAQTSRQLGALAKAARDTNTRFSDLADPGIELRDLKFWDPYNDSAGAKVASEIRATYTVPLQKDGSTMPLGPVVTKITIDLEPGLGGPGGSDNGGASGSSPGAMGSPTPRGGGESGDGQLGTPQESGPGTSPVNDKPTADQNALGSSSDSTGGGPGSGQQSGVGAPSGTGTGADGTAGGTGLPDGTDGALTDTEPYDTSGQVSPLLSPAGVTPSGSTAGRGGLGTSGLRGGGGTTASPLGLRPDGASLRGTAPAAVAGASATTGARSSMPLGGVPAGAAGGQRGQGDGRHRTPGYLIDRANGEELVGGLPLVGPGVIGEWRADKAPEAPRPPVRGEPRRN
ncbi:hypothetical protein TTY48_41990 [Tsukamurella sp. TY48]|nr:hypothetical protein TTY48_41990 [Tsukamurella sp. TY48]